jgi:hypothetical protein
VSPVVAIAFGFCDQTHEIRFPLPSGQWRRQLSSRDQCWMGPGDESPEQIASTGEMSLTVSGPSAFLFTRTG